MNKNDVLKIIVDTLNEALLLDRGAISSLVCNRVPCNVPLACHPTIEVMANEGRFRVGMLGVLTGLAKKISGDDRVVIVATVDEETHEVDEFNVAYLNSDGVPICQV